MGLQYQPGQPSNRPVGQHLLYEQDLDIFQSSSEFVRNTSSARCIAREGSGEFGVQGLTGGMRRIHFSIGADAKRWGCHYISGFRFDYHDPSRSSIAIGQWMASQDSLEIAVGERIVKLTFWYFKTGQSQDLSGFCAGRIAAARFDTSHERSLTFKAVGVNPTRDGTFVKQKFQPNFGETMVSHMALLLSARYSILLT